MQLCNDFREKLLKRKIAINVPPIRKQPLFAVLTCQTNADEPLFFANNLQCCLCIFNNIDCTIINPKANFV